MLFDKYTPAADFDGFIIPTADEFLGEYIPDDKQRIKLLTGFTGSNGLAVISKTQDIFITDGRYTLQAKYEIPNNFMIYDFKDIKIADILKRIGRIGLDARLHSVSFVQNLMKSGVLLDFLENNPLDKFLPKTDKITEIYDYPLEFAGLSRGEKIADLRKFIDLQGADAYFIFDPHEVNWLLNIRGNSLKYTPIVNCHALVTQKNIYLIGAKFTGFDYLESLETIKPLLKDLKVLFYPSCNYFSYKLLQENAKEIQQIDVNYLEHKKAVKNTTEIDLARKVHYCDGLAVQGFLKWIQQTPEKDEISAAEKLLDYRRAQPNFVSESFAAISAFGANGAIIHYHPKPSTNVKIKENGLYLIDSGGQYLGGTTDVTRTIAIGTPTQEQKRNFTLVLKGHIALATACFKRGTTGSELDILTRQYLWAEGLDYAHGTGHGVGSFLSVHEGPQSISRFSKVPLEAGMILSNEPGFYKSGEYGIRIESLILVVESKFKDFLEFEILTRIPIDTGLIDFDILTRSEKNWLDWYNNEYCKL